MRIALLITLLMPIMACYGQKDALVVRVKDGDTFVAVWDGVAYDCRLLNVDAPEMGQSFGVASRDSVAKIILGKMVSLDPVKKDLYGRTLVYVRLGNIRLDSLLIRNGWAWQYVGYSSDPVLNNAMK
ncbi:MAG: thermonuclease family protein, partial [Cytophagales bacterium]|nr:thermonuclease family protein [Cytophagales bacterium]